MLDFGDFVFAAPPSHGAHRFLKWCDTVGLKVERESYFEDPPLPDYKEKLIVTVVCHPCAWLDYYFTTMKDFPIGVREVDAFRMLNSWNMETFVTDYLQRLPGAVGKMWEVYRADTCLREEGMPWNVLEFFASLNVSVAPQVRENMRVSVRHVPVFGESGLWHKVMEAEKEFCKHFEYYV